MSRVKAISQPHHAARQHQAEHQVAQQPLAEAEPANQNRRRSSLTGFLRPGATVPNEYRSNRRASHSAEATVARHAAVATTEEYSKINEEMKSMQTKIDELVSSSKQKDEVLGKVLGDMETSQSGKLRTRTAVPRTLRFELWYTFDSRTRHSLP